MSELSELSRAVRGGTDIQSRGNAAGWPRQMSSRRAMTPHSPTNPNHELFLSTNTNKIRPAIAEISVGFLRFRDRGFDSRIYGFSLKSTLNSFTYHLFQRT